MLPETWRYGNGNAEKTDSLITAIKQRTSKEQTTALQRYIAVRFLGPGFRQHTDEFLYMPAGIACILHDLLLRQGNIAHQTDKLTDFEAKCFLHQGIRSTG